MEILIMDWIRTILEKHTDENGKLNLEEAQKEINAEFPKNAVPKTDFNSKVEELKTANETLTTLQKDNKDVEALQTEITSYKEKVETLQKEQAETTKKHTIESALKDAGAKDVEYLTFKLGDVEVNKDGTIKDLDNKIKSLQEATPDFFETKSTESKNQDSTAPGYKVVDNKLDKGKQGTTYSFDELSKLTPEEINNNWEAVSTALEQGDDK